MRILHLDAGKEMRGGQWQVLRLVEGLAGAGVESTLLARSGGPLFEAYRETFVGVGLPLFTSMEKALEGLQALAAG